MISRFAEGSDGVRRLWLWCPGCDELHQVVDGVWQVDVSVPDRPTVSPSILVRGGRQGSDHVCHSFVRGGQWEFLPDSTHGLAGQTVSAVPLPEWAAGGQ